MSIPTGCCDDRDPRLAMARYLVRCAFGEALRQRSNNETALIVMGLARMVAIDLLVERGMRRQRARQLVDDSTRMLEQMTDQMAKEAGLA